MVAMGLLKWVACTVSDPSFFKLLTDSTPVHLALLDEVSPIVEEWGLGTGGVYPLSLRCHLIFFCL